MTRHYWLLIALFLGSCAGHTFAPPSIPGLVTIPDAIGCTAVAVGEDAAWAVLVHQRSFSIRNELARIDLDSNQVTATVRNVQKLKRDDLAFDWFGLLDGPDIEFGSAALWVPNAIGDDEPAIWKVDSDSGEVKFANDAFTHVAIGERAVWVANLDNKLLRIDAETAQLSFAIELHIGALDVAVTDGAVWVLHPDATISRVDPATNRVLGAIRLPAGYSALAASSDAIWLATPTSPWAILSAAALNNVEPAAMLDQEERQGAELARLDPGANRIVARIPFAENLGPVIVMDIVAGQHSVWVSFIASSSEDSQGSKDRLWLAEIDTTTNELSRMIPLSRFKGNTARLALVKNDLLVCASAIWRIPLDALRAASLPPQNGPAQ